MPVSKSKPVKKHKKPLLPNPKENIFLKLTQEQTEVIAAQLGNTWPEHYTPTHFWETRCWSCKSLLWFACLTKEDAWGKPVLVRVSSDSSSVTPTCFDGVFLCYNCEKQFERVPTEKVIDESTTKNEKLYNKFLKGKNPDLRGKVVCTHKRDDGSICKGPVSSNFFKKAKS